MDQKGKLPVIILVFLIVVSLVAAGVGFYLLQQEKRKSTQLQEQLESVKTSERVAKKQLEDWQDKYAALDMKLTDANTRLENLKTDLQQETKLKQESLAKIEQLRIDLDQQKNLRSDLETKLSRAQKSLDNIQTQVNELSAKKQELESQVKELQDRSQGVELGKIVVGPESTEEEGGTIVAKSMPAPATASEGKVLVVNNEHDFIVFNLGSKNGVKIGDVYSVYRGNRNLGDVKVEKVQDNMAAAGFVGSNVIGKISEGDRILFKVR